MMRDRTFMMRTFQTLVLVASVAFASGQLAMAAEGQAPAEPASSRTETEPLRTGSCPCCDPAPDGGESVTACPGRGPRAEAEGVHPRHGGGYGMRREAGSGPGRSGRRGGPDVMQATRALVHDYRDSIVREVEEIDNGVVTVTRSPDDPEAVPVLQRHVREMQGLLESGGRIRAWDPLFREIFDHYSEVDMVVEPLDDGVRVTETSDNPEVVKLIQAHARKVNEFLARGPAAVHESTPLPEEYGAGG